MNLSSGLALCSKDVKDVLRYCCAGVWNYPCRSRHSVSVLLRSVGAQCLEPQLLLNV